MIAFAAAIALSVAVLVALVRAARGPTPHDRAMGAYTGLVCVAVWIAAVAALDRRPAWADIALALLLVDAIVAIAVFKVFRVRSLQTALARREQDGQGS